MFPGFGKHKCPLTTIFIFDYDLCRMKLSARSIKSSLSKGFTLIELLVVIGILGILAAALVATIDPFEQLKKADDSKIKNIAVEFQTANVRYYTTHGAFPWNDLNNTNTDCTGITWGGAVQLDQDPGMLDCIDGSTGSSLTGEGELKKAFATNLTDLNKVSITWDSSDATNLIVCFSPTSKSQKAAPDTRYNQDGSDADPANCPKATAPDGTCYWCTR